MANQAPIRILAVDDHALLRKDNRSRPYAGLPKAGSNMKPAISATAIVLALIPFAALNAEDWSRPVIAPDTSLDIPQYTHTIVNLSKTYPGGLIYAMAQTPDGYVWLGTESGLVRFDGVRTQPLRLPSGQAPRINSVFALTTAHDGALWIGARNGLFSWKNGRLTQHPALAKDPVNAVLEDRNGTVWAGATGSPNGKLCALRGESSTCYGAEGNLGSWVTSLYEDAQGRLWVGAATGLWRWDPGPPTRYLSDPLTYTRAITQADHGADVVVAMNVVQQVTGTKVMRYPLAGLPTAATAAHLLRDRTGGLWIGTKAHGVVHSWHGKTALFTRKDGLSSDFVYAMFEDREGTIWVATARGLDQFRELPVRSLEGLSGADTILAARDGGIWIGTQGDGLHRWEHGRLTTYRRRSYPGLPDDSIQTLYEDERGRIWISCFHGLSVFEDGKFTAVPGLSAGGKSAMVGDGHGGLWLSDQGAAGLIHLVGHKIVEQFSWNQFGGLPDSDLLVDRDGGIWAGLLDGRVGYLHNGEVRRFSSSGEGEAGNVLNFGRFRDGSLWAGTENGLTRIANGRVTRLTTANGLPCNSVHWVMEDDVSSYWVMTHCGLVRIGRSEWDKWTSDPGLTIQATTLSEAEGVTQLGKQGGHHPQFTKASDGRIWFLIGDTAAMIDPSRIVMNNLPPPVHIEQIVADDKPYDLRPGMRLPANVRNLQINYTALSLVAPEKIHFKYKLEGQNQNWREVINERQATYTNLPPSNYRFRVIASNNSGVWNETGDSLEFSIAPAYNQTTWFYALCVAASLAMFWGLYRMRLYQIRREFNAQLDGRVDERTRIARDLHDTLLQSFQGLIPVFQTARNLLPGQSDRAAQVLDEGLHDAADAIVEGRNAIQNLRPKSSMDQDLGLLLNAAGLDLASSLEAEGSTPAFRVVVEGSRLPLAPLLQDEIYRIGREMLRNAFRHAHASRIEAEIRYDRDGFRLRVRDDGKGIDSKVLKEGARAGHWGLPGIHERTKRMGGSLKIWSEPGAGTEAELTVPARIAYEKFSTSNGWWARLGRRLRLTAPNREA